MVSAGLLLMYGLGAIIGPFMASSMMTLGSVADLFLFTAVIHLLLTVYVVLRSMRKRQTTAAEHRPFSDALASTQTRSQVYEEELEKNMKKLKTLNTLSLAGDVIAQGVSASMIS